MIDPPTQEVTVKNDGYTLTKGLSARAKNNHGAPSLRGTIIKQVRWDESTFNCVVWVAYIKAFTRLTRSRQIGLTKISHGLLNTNYQNSKYYGTSSTCPCCWDDIEVLTHVFICPQDEVTGNREKQFNRLINDLTTIGTLHLISSAILHDGITSWVNMKLEIADSSRSPLSSSVIPTHMIITKAYNDQSLIGWDLPLRGRPSKLWYDATNFVKLTEGLKPDPTWTSYLIASFLTYFVSLWHFRWGVLHGHSQEETIQKQLEKLHQQIIQAYQEYMDDPYVIASHLHSIFTSQTAEE